MPKSSTAQALILKRHNYGETDRVVTLITREWGKITVIAKGARKLHSSKRGILEPGNLIKGFFVETKQLPYLTQAQLVSSAMTTHCTLEDLRNLQLVLELFDRILVEEELETDLFAHLLEIRENIVAQTTHRGQIRQALNDLLSALGYPSLAQSEYGSITDYVADLTNKPLRSWEFLQARAQ